MRIMADVWTGLERPVGGSKGQEWWRFAGRGVTHGFPLVVPRCLLLTHNGFGELEACFCSSIDLCSGDG
jgi:hypothetical protein